MVLDLRVLAVREICEEPDVLINRMITVFTFLRRCEYFEDMIATTDSTCDLFAGFSDLTLQNSRNCVTE